MKRLKDPIYGYIDIPEDIMTGVVDTAIFQRLRRVTQTSYAPLYSSAVHNRFVHSLGVYYLGAMAAKTISQECTKFESKGGLGGFKEEIGRYVEVFKLACLLHDVGHAPFSHTGESFYLENDDDYTQLHSLLKDTVGSEEFSKDISEIKIKYAAPHEIMSAIVGIREFPTLLTSTQDKDFFARCITGYAYPVGKGREGILNCFILLLNSKIIDVDKLDYLIRDAYTTGFNTVQIDYERLLTALTIIEEDGQYSLAYNKSALSVIENVVYAHDSERKWIQSHPVILYESYLLQHIMELLAEKLDSEEHRLFSIESLSGDGQTFEDSTQVRLMGDDDIIYLSKRYYKENEFVHEYFERRYRRHPLWKSEAEYRTFFQGVVGEGEAFNRFEKAMESTALYLSKNTTNWLINRELADKISTELQELETAELDDATRKTQQKEKQEILKIIDFLLKYDELGGSLVILKAPRFNSNFAKSGFASIKIVFPSPSETKIKLFGDVVSVLSSEQSERKKFFYLYYKRKESGDKSLDINILGREMLKVFV